MVAQRCKAFGRLAAALILAVAAFPAVSHQPESAQPATISSASVIATGTVTELRVENQLTGQSIRYLGLRLDDGQSLALIGPGLESLGKGARIEATGVVAGQSFRVTTITSFSVSDKSAPTATSQALTRLSGKLAIYHKDFFDQGRGELGLVLVSSTGQIVQLTVAVIPDWFEPGMAITAEGTLTADGVSLDVDTITVMGMGPATNAEVAGAPVTNKVLVMAIRFADSGANPYTPAQIDTVMQTRVAPYYQDVSYGQQLLNITTVPSWLQDAGNVPISAFGPNAGYCDYDTIGQRADALATALGYTPANYQNKYYFLPSAGSCPWAGLAYVGSGPYGRTAFSNGYNALWVYGHELGHNFGLLHAGSTDCHPQVVGAGCGVAEYGDPFDVMGNNSQQSMHFNAMQKSSILHWIPSTAPSVMTHATGTQTYTLSPLESPGQTTYAVKIPVATNPNRTYWIEYRQPIGPFDGGANGIGSYPNLGAQIRVASPFESSSGADNTELLDMTPGSAGGFGDAALLAGQTYTDSTGISIHVISATAGALTLSVSAPGASPAPTAAGAVSRKTHGAAGVFDLPLSMVATNPTTEPRQGPAQTIAFDFGKPITSASVAVTEGIASASAPTFSGNSVIVNLSGVANQQYVTVALSNVVSADGGTGGTGSVRVGFLVGDVNQSRAVSLSDLVLVNAALAHVATASNYLKDVNASGVISLADIVSVNTNLAKALPAP
jgi:hypothetical protein